MSESRITIVSPAALVALAFAVPFLLLNAVVANRLEPLFSALRPGPGAGPFEYPLLFGVLGLGLVGAVVALRTVVQKASDGSRRYPILNIVVAVVMLVGFTFVTVGLGDEIYRCDILNQPFCD